MKRYIGSIIIATMCVIWFPSSSAALTNEEVFSQFQFNFLTPGARATALGGAFIGLADDATAVESNPAGLTQLYDPEVSVEYKYISYTTEQIFENFPPEGESIAGDIRRREFDDSVEGVPFLSVAFPYKWFVFSLYRQVSVNYKSSYRTSQFPIALPGFDYFDGNWIFPVEASVDLTVTNYGIGLAFQLPAGFSVAVSPRWSELKMKSSSSRFAPDPTLFSDTADSVFPYPVDFADEDQITNATRIDDEDGEFSGTAGLLWRIQWLEEKLDIPRVSLGLVYRSGAEFKITENFSPATFVWFIPETYEDVSDISEFTLKVPDSYGFGLAVRPLDDLAITFDVVHIEYEDLLEDFDLVYSNPAEENITIDNTTEIHLGLEYVLPPIGERLLALRAGVYYEPDHTIRFTGTTDNEFNDTLNKNLFPGGDDQLHLTGGVGLVISEHFQIDTAVNVAEKNRQFSVSAVYRF